MKKEKKVQSGKAARRKAAIVKAIKSLALPVILCAIIFAGVYFVVTFQAKEAELKKIEIKGYDGGETPIVLENDDLVFTLDPTTTQFELMVKETGKVWYSTPVDAANDVMALTAEKSKLQSTLIMTFSKDTGLETEYNNFGYSINNGLYNIEAGEDYVRIDYTLGDIEREYYIPPVTTATKFNEWLSKMELKDQNKLKDYYKKYDINKLGRKDNKEELLEKYPILADEVIYVLRDTTQGKIRVDFEKIFADAGYTMEDYEADKILNQSETTTDKPVFNISMIYRLEGDELVVEVPLKDLEYQADDPIYKISMLPYFGAGGTTDEGFLLVPEGGGAIINFNNGKTAQNQYYTNMYGRDYALVLKDLVNYPSANFNAFGIANGEDSFICMLEGGAPYAAVQADISGRNHSYNYVNAAYTVCFREQYDVGAIASSDIYVYIDELPDETLSQRYRFVNSNSYVDMAKEYQDYLLDNYGDVLTANADTSTPVAFEIVGAVDKVRQILGVPTSMPLKLTTFKEAGELITQLKNDGINNMTVKLSGWCNGGVKQQMLTKVKPISSLGGKKGLNNLIDTAKNLGVDLYLEGITQYAHNSNLLDGFFSYRDAAKTIAKERAELFQYSAVTYAAREGAESYWLLHTDLAHEMTDNLIKATSGYGTGVAFKDLGMDLSSDFYKKDVRSRQSVMNGQVEKLKSVKTSGQNILINYGNLYALPYSTMITNMELEGNKHTLLDANVPFLQTAIHGYVNYTGTPINISGNDVEEVLAAAEYGAGLHFTIMKESAFALQKTLYTEYYGSDYATWHDRMLEIYTRYNSELGHTYNQQIVDHKVYTEDVRCTTYEDGTKVYVNYGNKDYTTEDGLIPASDYKVVR
ncbi:MAG: hypothetical protein IKK33_06205 [Lachnospiraceae bacterium]|nr:hypothetical protein [Lachnospiraceae bacterium]